MVVVDDASIAVTPATGRRMTLAGVAAVVAFVASLVTLAAMAAGSFPLPTAAAGDVARYLTDNGGAVQVSALLQAVLAGTSILALAVDPASVAIPLGRFLTFGWILAVVPVPLWRTRPGTRRPHPDGR